MRPTGTIDSRLLLERLAHHKVMAIIRGTDVAGSVATCLTLADAGILLLEVSLTTRDAFDVLHQVATQIPAGVVLGAGTVLDPHDVRRALDAGAQFIVTPALAPSIEMAEGLGLPVLAGAMTPSEVHEAQTRGAAAVKIFPASILGPRYVRALRDPFPTTPLMAVGGVDTHLAVDFIAAGAIGVGVGSPLCGDAPHGGDLEALRERARGFVAVAHPHVSEPR